MSKRKLSNEIGMCINDLSKEGADVQYKINALHLLRKTLEDANPNLHEK